MVIDNKTRKKLIDILNGVDYRKIISDRVGCHPNTVYNVLHTPTDNPRVEHEILVLAQEVKAQKDQDDEFRRKSRAIVKQL